MRKALAVVLILLAAAAAYLWMNPEQLTAIRSSVPNTEQTMYRWKDDRGQWVVSDERPTDDRPFEEVRYDRDANVMPSGN